jgi:hypothetical protein
LPKFVASLACSLFSPMPTVLSSSVEPFRIAGLHSQERLVPAHHLRHRAQAAQRCHHQVGRGLVDGPIDRQEHAVRAAPCRRPHRQPGVHALQPGLVRGGRDDAALGRVPVAADHDWLAPQLRPPQHLDRRDELVEVDVQHPGGHLSSLAPAR